MKPKLHTPRKTSPQFKVGDLVTGIDRSYKRSVYKFISTTESDNIGIFEFQSLNGSVVDSYKDSKAPRHTYEFSRLYSEFRLANRDELNENDKYRSSYKLLKLLRLLKIHPRSRF